MDRLSLHFAVGITDACCGTDGFLQFTSQAFAVDKIHSTGIALRELFGLNVFEPWLVLWWIRSVFRTAQRGR